jgi:hypothetical protein
MVGRQSGGQLIPAYVITILVLSLLIGLLPRTWTDADNQFPLCRT